MRVLQKRQGSATVTIDSATFKFSSACEYSDTYHMFTTKEDKFQGSPPPHPPSESKEDIFDSEEFKFVDKRAKEVEIITEREILMGINITNGQFSPQ